eukprot:3611831-Rhodomonas_salina.2
MAYQLHSTEIAYAPTETSPSSAVCGGGPEGASAPVRQRAHPPRANRRSCWGLEPGARSNPFGLQSVNAIEFAAGRSKPFAAWRYTVWRESEDECN